MMAFSNNNGASTKDITNLLMNTTTLHHDYLGVWWHFSQSSVILEQNPSSILISEPIGPGKWVVENFDFYKPHLHVIQLHRLMLNPFTVKYLHLHRMESSFIKWNFSPEKLDPHSTVSSDRR